MADLVSTVHASNLPAAAKASIIDRWIDKARGAERSVLARAGIHGMQAVHTITDVSVGLVTGAAAGFVHATIGLDKQMGDVTVPIDAVGAGVMAAVAIGGAHIPGARQAGVIAAELGTVFAFRKVYDFTAAKRKAAGQAVGGTFAGEDTSWAAPAGHQGMQAELQALAQSLGR